MNTLLQNTTELTGNDIFMKRLCTTLGVLCVCMAVVYGYCINATIKNIVTRQKSDSASVQVRSQVAELETQHIVLRNQITPAYAHQRGYVEVMNPQYVSYHTSAQSLSLNTIK